MIVGKQIQDLSITPAKLNITTAVNANSQKITNLGAPTADTDAARLADILAMPWKDKCIAATTANVTVVGGAPTSVDGVTLALNNRVLVRAQTAQAENGIYTVTTLGTGANGTWTRAIDADSAVELRGAVISIEQGTLYADHRFAQTADNITLGTTAIVFVDIGVGTPAAFDTTANKSMNPTGATSGTGLTLAAKPSGLGTASAYPRVMVNGLAVTLGDGVKTKEAYFSADSGSTAKSLTALAAADVLYWNGVVAGYDLATTDVIEIDYAV
jgi:hypothetical protein